MVFYEGSTRISPTRRGATAPKVRTVIGPGHEVGRLRVHSVPGQLDYMLGECGRLYGGKRVKRWQRTLIYLRPTAKDQRDYLVIRDRTETDSPSLVPHVVFQTVLEPRIGPDRQNDEKGDLTLPGQWRIRDCPCATVTNDCTYTYAYPRRTHKAHARAFVRTLLPQSMLTLKIGGEKHAFDGLDGKPASKYLDRFNKLPLPQKLTYAGLWRLHIVPREKAKKHLFLHVIEATDSRVARPGAISLLKCTGATALQARLNVVLFSRDDGPLKSANVKVAARTTRAVVGDLIPGKKHSITAGGKNFNEEASAAGSILVTDIDLAPGDTVGVALSE